MVANGTSPPVLRQISVRAVMDELLHGGPASRVDLARATGLSKQTMSEVIRNLESAGWVRVRGMTSGRVGRSAVTYEVVPDRGYVVGADLGPTTSRLAVANIAGDVVACREIDSDPRGGRHVMRQLTSLKSDIVAGCGVDPEGVLVAAVAAPGVVDPEDGRLVLASNLAGLSDLNISEELADGMGCDVVVENDINAAVIGESWRGCAVGIDEVAFISLGTGVGLGALVGGRLLRGATGAAGEISFMPFGGDLRAPESLKRGTLECAIGARGICDAYVAGGGEDTGVLEILARAEAGEDRASALVADVSRTAARLVVAVDALLDPSKIVLGGNIGRHPLIVRHLLAALPEITRRRPVVEPSHLGRQATLMGAVAIALNEAHNALFSPHVVSGPIRLSSAGK